MTNWDEVDRILQVASTFKLNDEELKQSAHLEQKAYESNFPKILEILEEHKLNLEQRDFWAELQASIQGLRFRYSYPGFFGPGGFSSQFHVDGPLILGIINPKKDAVAVSYSLNLEDNIFLGTDFDEIAFVEFITDNLMKYLQPENMLISAERYQWIRSLLAQAPA